MTIRSWCGTWRGALRPKALRRDPPIGTKPITSRDVIDQLGALGLMGMLVPEEWDGAMSDTVAYAAALEEIAAGNGAISTIMSVHNSVGCVPILRFGTDAQRDEFLRPIARGEALGAFCLTEPQAGSDASALRTRAIRTATGWKLDGVKQFITSGRNADIAIVFAVTDPNAGKKGLSAFIVPTKTPGWTVISTEEKTGQHLSDTAQIALDGVEIAAGSPEEQDAFALASLSRALASDETGVAAAEITPVEAPAGRETRQVIRDQQPGQAKPEKISTLKPAFRQGGTVTAANSSSISDGAAALVLMRQSEAARRGLAQMARISGHSSYAHELGLFTTAPVMAITRLMDRTGWSIESVDLFEVNEAFAVVPMVAMRDLNIPHERMNVLGGACAMGHPIGASGARIVVTLLNALRSTGGRRSMAAACIGGGEAATIGIELM